MDPITIGLLKTVASQGVVASLLLLVGIMLYRNLKAKESCKDPSTVNPELPPRANPPCNQCLACKDRLLSQERVRFETKVDKLHDEQKELLREIAAAIRGHLLENN